MTDDRTGIVAAITEEAIEALADALAERLTVRAVKADGVLGQSNVVDARTVAGRIGASAQWVRDHASELGGWRLGTGSKAPYRFDLAEVERTLRAYSDGRRAPENENGKVKPNPRRSRRRRMGTNADLLPIRGSDPT